MVLPLERWLQNMVEMEAPAARRRFSLAELVAQCDPDAPLSDEDRAWLDKPAVGREAL
jgi:antitoxin ChpS